MRGAPLDPYGAGSAALPLDGVEQFPERVGEDADPVGQQRVRRVFQRDACFGQRPHRVAGTVEILREACARTAVIAEGRESRWRHRVDGVGPDQLLDVDYVAIAGVLRSRAGPQEPLRLRAALGQRAPARSAEQLPIPLEGELRVRDGDRTAERLQQRPLPRLAGLRQPDVERGVDGGIDAADEEARHAGDARGIAAARDERLETFDVRLGGALVDVLSEQQRDVDVDALGDQLAHRGDALRRAGHLDHQVGAADCGPQAPCVRKRALRVGCKER